MSLSQKDQQLWAAAMQGVTPLVHKQISPRMPHSKPVVLHQQKDLQHTWDLHGMTLQQAYALAVNQVQQQHQHWRYMTFVTGKSGRMREEFEKWICNLHCVQKVVSINDGGAYQVWFKKKSSNS